MTRHGADALAASQMFLGELDAAADLAVSVLVRGDDAELTALAASLLGLAGAAPLGIGAPRRRIASIAGLGDWASAGRAGPIEVLRSERTLMVRWEHRAGDAWTVQQLMLAAAKHSGLIPGGPWCDCAGWLGWLDADRRHAADRPHWATFRSVARSVPDARRPLAVARAGTALVRPLITRARPRLGAPPAPSDDPADDPADDSADDSADDRMIDEAVIAAVPRSAPRAAGDADAPASRFSVLAARALDALVDSGVVEPGRRGLRLGVTVDVRRHEPALAGAGAGNLVAIGYVQTPDPRRVRTPAADVHRAVQALLATRFWLSFLAADRLMSRAPAVTPALSRLAIALLRIAPVTMTELWRSSDRPCDRCGAPMAPTPPDWDVTVIPPAMPGGGVTIGLTRRPGGIEVLALRASRRADVRRLPQLEQAGNALGDVLSAGPTILV